MLKSFMLSLFAAVVLFATLPAQAAMPVTTDEARQATYGSTSSSDVTAQADSSANTDAASKTASATAEKLQSVEPAAGPSTDASNSTPVTTDEARGATY